MRKNDYTIKSLFIQHVREKGDLSQEAAAHKSKPEIAGAFPQRNLRCKQQARLSLSALPASHPFSEAKGRVRVTITVTVSVTMAGAPRSTPSRRRRLQCGRAPAPFQRRRCAVASGTARRRWKQAAPPRKPRRAIGAKEGAKSRFRALFAPAAATQGREDRAK